jgi:hypothetical protein
MATTSKKPLKEYIRIDGSGRTVPGSSILRKSKPKVGKWREIQEFQCCDPFFFTTTTTTTATPTTTTTTTAPSDVRLKTSIKLTGGKVGGLPEYTWKWNSLAIGLGLGHYPTKGIMAHEALINYPNAVVMAEDGYMRVDYSKIV